MKFHIHLFKIFWIFHSFFSSNASCLDVRPWSNLIAPKKNYLICPGPGEMFILNLNSWFILLHSLMSFFDANYLLSLRQNTVKYDQNHRSQWGNLHQKWHQTKFLMQITSLGTIILIIFHAHLMQLQVSENSWIHGITLSSAYEVIFFWGTGNAHGRP